MVSNAYYRKDSESLIKSLPKATVNTGYIFSMLKKENYRSKLNLML